jgi:putative transposase
MEFTEGDLFHIYNRGNNSRKIFFNRDNYLFFILKIREYILPYSNILSWCLMPTHFHLMIELLHKRLPPDKLIVKGIEEKDQLNSAIEDKKVRTLNDSIAIMLRSYTRAINLQENRTGSLFQQKTKSVCLNSPDMSPTYFNTTFGVIGNVSIAEYERPVVCFKYIHNNPVKHGKVDKPEEWEFSSYNDYFKNRGGNLINKKRAVELGLMYSSDDL